MRSLLLGPTLAGLVGCAQAAQRSEPEMDQSRASNVERSAKHLLAPSSSFDTERLIPLHDDVGEVRFLAPAGFRPTGGADLRLHMSVGGQFDARHLDYVKDVLGVDPDAVIFKAEHFADRTPGRALTVVTSLADSMHGGEGLRTATGVIHGLLLIPAGADPAGEVQYRSEDRYEPTAPDWPARGRPERTMLFCTAEHELDELIVNRYCTDYFLYDELLVEVRFQHRHLANWRAYRCRAVALIRSWSTRPRADTTPCGAAGAI